MDDIPNDLFLIILNKLDLQSKIFLLSTSKYLWSYKNNIYSDSFKILIDNEEHIYNSINEPIKYISNILLEYKYNKNELYFPLSINYQQFTLRFTKNKFNKCSCIITNNECIIPKYEIVQFLYECIYWWEYRLIKHNNTEKDINIPLKLFYIGMKIILKIHGYKNVQSFNDICNDRENAKLINLDIWIKKIIISSYEPKYIYSDIINHHLIL